MMILSEKKNFSFDAEKTKILSKIKEILSEFQSAYIYDSKGKLRPGIQEKHFIDG